MTSPNNKLAKCALAVSCALVVGACSDDDDSSSASTTRNQSFTVVDGYIQHADVCVKETAASTDCVATGETDANGQVTLTLPSELQEYVVQATIEAGKAIDSDSPFEFVAQSYVMQSDDEQSGYVTPFTTVAANNGKTIAELATDLGLTEQDLSGDPTLNPEIHLLARSVVDNLLSQQDDVEDEIALLDAIQDYIETLDDSLDLDDYDVEVDENGDVSSQETPYADVSYDFADQWDDNEELPVTVSPLEKYLAVLVAADEQFDDGPEDLIEDVLEQGLSFYDQGVLSEVVTFVPSTENPGEYLVMISKSGGEPMQDGVAKVLDFGLLEVTFTENGNEFTEHLAFYQNDEQEQGFLVAFLQGYPMLSSLAGEDTTIPAGYGEIYNEPFQFYDADSQPTFDDSYYAVAALETDQLTSYEDDWNEEADKPETVSSLDAYNLLIERIADEVYDTDFYTEFNFDDNGELRLTRDGEFMTFKDDNTFVIEEANGEMISGTWQLGNDGRSVFLDTEAYGSEFTTLIYETAAGGGEGGTLRSIHFSYGDGTYLDNGVDTPLPEGFAEIWQAVWTKL